MASVAAAIAIAPALIAPGVANAAPNTDPNQTIATAPAEQEGKTHPLGGPRKGKDRVRALTDADIFECGLEAAMNGCTAK
jgi:hypothetical protein